MRNLIYIFLSLMCVVGCSVDNPVVYDPEVRLLFKPEMYMHVNDENVDRYPVSQDFGVSAWVSGKEWIELGRAYAQEVFLSDSDSTFRDSLWGFSRDFMWPGRDEVLSIIAYSPFTEDCTVTLEKGVRWETDILKSQTDLLYAHVNVDRKDNVDNNVVNLSFCHSLSQVKFRVKNRVDNNGDPALGINPDMITVYKITIDGVYNKGSFRSLPSPEWELEMDWAPLPVFEGSIVTSGVPEPIGASWLVIPQSLNTRVTVEFGYTTVEGTTITQVLKTVPIKTQLKGGRCYTYTLSIGIDDVKFLEELIEDDLKK